MYGILRLHATVTAEPLQAYADPINSRTWVNMPIAQGCEFFHLMQLATVLCR